MHPDKVFISPSSTVSLFLVDPVDGGVATQDGFQWGQTFDTRATISPLFNAGWGTGVISGGVLSAVGPGPLDVSATGGLGYLMVGVEPTDHIKTITWAAQTITVTDDADNFIFIDQNFTLQSALSAPGRETAILLGKARSNAGSILFMQEFPTDARHIGQRVNASFEDALGPVYISGSLTTINGGNPLQLDVGSGKYVYGSHQYSPSGANPISFSTWLLNGSGGYKVGQASTNLVDAVNYDDGTGTLAPIPAGQFVRDVVYISGDGPYETYLFEYGQTVYPSQAAAAAGTLPGMPGTWTGNIAPIVSLIIEQATGSIVELIDERPVPTFRATALTGVTVHGNLTGLLADDHPQYLLVNGSRAMSGNLNMNNFNIITGSGLVDNVDVSLHGSRHNPLDVDPVTTLAPVTIGTTNQLGLQNALSRSDHVHAHGNQPGGTLHSVATTSIAGFMSAADKTALDNIVATTGNFVQKTGDTMSGDLVMSNGTATTYQATSNTNTVSLHAPASITSSYILQLPSAQGAANQALVQSGTPGILTWSSVAQGDISNGGNSFGIPITIGTNDAFDTSLRSNGVDRLSITPAGAVGIAAPTTGVGLTVTGNAASSAASVTAGAGQTAIVATSATGNSITTSLGSASAPAYSFTGDGNTGLYSPGADQIALTNGGSSQFLIDAGGTVNVGIPTVATQNALSVFGASSAAAVRIAAAVGQNSVSSDLGSAIAPAYSFIGDPNTGIYSPAGDQISLSTGGTARLSATTSDITSTLPITILTGFGTVYQAGTGVNTVTLSGPAAAIGTSYSLRLPTAQGTAGQTLVLLNGTGDLTWSTNAVGDISQGGNSFGTTMTIGTNDAQSLVLETSNTPRVTITSAGAVSIAAPTTGVGLTVNGNAGSTGMLVNAGLGQVGVSILGSATAGALRVSAALGQNAVFTSLGTVGAPAYSFIGDSNTGVYSPGADQIALVTNGIAQFSSTTSNITSLLPITMSTGAATVYQDGAATNTVSVRAPAAVVTSYTVQLPIAQGGPGQALAESVTPGILTWVNNTTSGGNTFGAAISIGTNDAFNMSLRTNGADRLSITSAGAVSIAAPTTGVGLTVNGNTTSTAASVVAGTGQTGLSVTGATGAAAASVTAGAAQTAIVATSATGNSITTSSGTAALPAYAFTANQNLGIYSPSASNIAIATVGTQRLTVDGGGTVTIAAPTVAAQSALIVAGAASAPAVSITQNATQSAIAAGLGSATACAYSFTNDSNTGLYSPGADQVALSTGGTARLTATTTGITSTLPITMSTGVATVYQDGAATNTVSLRAPAAVTTSYVLQLPVAQGAASQVLAQSGTPGILTWSSVGTGDINNGGNTFGAAISIGTNDAFSTSLRSNGANRLSITSAGAVSIAAPTTGVGLTVNGNATSTATSVVAGTGQTGLSVTGATGASAATVTAGAAQTAIVATSATGNSITASAGTASLPAYAFTANQNLGVYSPVANSIAISTVGTQRVTVNGAGGVTIAAPTVAAQTALSITGAATAPAVSIAQTSGFNGIITDYGLVGSPAYSFSGETNTGIYGTSGSLQFAVQGARRMIFTPGLTTIDGTSNLLSLYVVAAASGSSIGVDDGTAAAPAYTFANDLTMGMYRSGASSLGVSTNGAQRMNIGSTGAVSVLAPTSAVVGLSVASNAGSNAVATSLGTAALPSYSFTGDPNTGMYSPGADQISMATNGTDRLQIDTTGSVKPFTTYKMNAYRNSDQGPITPVGGVIVVCNTEVFDPSGSYNNATGVFTAPATGYYLVTFSTSSITTSATANLIIQFRINGSASPAYQISGSYAATGATRMMPMTLTSLIQLTAGQTLDVFAVPSANNTITLLANRTSLSIHYMSF